MGFCILTFYLAIIAVAWYTFMFCIGPVLFSYSSALAVILILIFNFLFVCQVYPYFVCVLRDPGTVSQEWCDLVKQSARDAAEGMRTVEGPPRRSEEEENVTATRSNEVYVMGIPLDFETVRWCRKCNRPKPDRAHHCHICNRCILKMDHHCPWISNCVGFRTYKYFVQMLLFSVIGCVYFGIVGFSSLVLNYPTLGGRMMAMLVSILVLALALGALILLGTHLYFIAGNKTTLECNDMNASPYSLGSARKNIEAVCGKQMWKWFIVFFRPPLEGGGYYFPRSDINPRDGQRHPTPPAFLLDAHPDAAQQDSDDDARPTVSISDPTLMAPQV